MTFRDTPHIYGRHVVFGKIISGLLSIIEKVATDSNDRPRSSVLISDCGQIGIIAEDTAGKSIEKNKVENSGENIYLPKRDKQHNQETGQPSSTLSAEPSTQNTNNEREEVEEEEKPLNEEEIAARTAGMTETEKRLFKIRLKLNQSRKLDKKEVEEEYRRLADPKYDQKQRAKEWTEKKKNRNKEQKDLGLGAHESFMLDTAEKAERLQEKAAEKERHRSTFGWQAFTSDALHNAYEKRLKKLPQKHGGPTTSEASLENNLLDYGKVGAQIVPIHLERMSSEIEEREQARSKYSRRRQSYDSSNVDFINDDNAHFNKKTRRAFDKYTVEIRQNLERGTAI